jgi:cruciform cutting endonuclease 1
MIEKFRALKAADLKHLAIETGTYSSGNKSLVSSRLAKTVEQWHGQLESSALDDVGRSLPTAFNKHQVLSIDMGIRNLAYCRVTLPAMVDVLGSRSSYLDDTVKPNISKNASVPTLHEWSRLTISEASTTDQNREILDNVTLAHLAYDLVHRLVLSQPSPPDTILIERQRFRSMGGSAVQEWTLRVNVFEAMLWAVLHTAQRREEWSGQVHAIDPVLVSKWCERRKQICHDDPDVAVLGRRKKNGGKSSASRLIKKTKIDLVDRWLQDTTSLHIHDRARFSTDRFISALRGCKDYPRLDKIDDLADTLVQALAWASCKQFNNVALAIDSAKRLA